jgi:transcriptional regulator with XRE-family HTH domain
MEIGERIRAIRQARGLTLSHLSAISGLDVASLSLLETGKVDPHLKTLSRVAAALGVQAADLFTSRKDDDSMATETAVPAETAVGLLTVAAVAAELGTRPLAISRLIARRRLKAVPLGASGSRRILASEVARYVGAGAPDFDTPPMGARWFSDIQYAAAFGDAIREAALEQLPAKAPTVADGQAVLLRITPALVAVITGQPRGPWNAVVKTNYPDWRTMYFINLVRGHAEKALAMKAEPLAALYADPEAYTRVVGEAVAQTLAGSISMTKSYLVEAPGRVPEWFAFQFELPHSALAPGNTMGTVLDLAF